MPKHIRAGALTALVVAGLTTGSVLAATAVPAAAAAPKFLSASELPPHPSSSWTAGKVTDGVPDEFQHCLGEALLGYDSRYRAFHTDLDTGARQLTVVTGSTTKAKALAARLNEDFQNCELPDPDTEAEYRNLGTLPVEEGAQVHGRHTFTSWGATDIQLLSVGRDGRTVTVVDWSQMGDFEDAPVKAFRKTTTTAVDKLH